MPQVVDEIITIYRAEDRHGPIAQRVAQQQAQLGRTTVDYTKAKAQAEQTILKEHRALQASLRTQTQAAKAGEAEAKERTATARAITAETRAREALARAAEKEERATRQLGAARRFANGFGSTRLNFGAASPLVSSFTRGGFAGGAGALAATGLAGGMSLAASAASGMGNLLSGGVSAGFGLLGQLGEFSTNAATEASSRRARLTAILRDAQMAQQVLKTVQGVATPSTATTKQLADAAVTLEAFGVNANRAIPIIGKLATAMGAGEEQMQMYSRAIGELGTGNMIDADVMAAMGLQRRDFAAQGIQFDGNGKLLSSAEQALTALEKIVEQRFGNIFEQMGNTPEAKRASLMDAGERAAAIIGEGLLKTQGPMVDALTRNLNAAVDSGVLGEVVTKASGEVFTALNLGGQGELVTSLMARVMAFAEIVPGNLAKGVAYVKDFTSAAINNVSEFFKMAEDRAARFMSRIALTFAQGQHMVEGIATALNNPLAAMSVMQSTFRDVAQMGSTFRTLEQAFPAYQPNYRQLPTTPSFASMDAGRITEIESRLRASMAAPQQGVPTSNAAFLRRALAPEASAQKKAEETLGRIAESTEATARNTAPELRDAIFGGSARARRGISFADVMGGPGGGSRPRITINATGMGEALQQELENLAQKIVDDTFAVFQLKAGWL